MTEPDTPEDQEALDLFMEYLVQVVNDEGHPDSQSDPAVMEDEVLEELMVQMSAGPSADLREHFAAVGHFISQAAEIEQAVQALASQLLNPRPGFARAAVRQLNASSTRQLAATLLVPRWPDTKRLFDELKRVAEMRNRFAHNALSSNHLSEDRQSFVHDVRLTYQSKSGSGVKYTTMKVSVAYIEEWASRAGLAGHLLHEVIRAVAFGDLFKLGDPTGKLDDFLDDEHVENSTLSVADRELFNRFWI